MRYPPRMLGLYALILGAIGVPMACAAEGNSGEVEPLPTDESRDSSAFPPYDANGSDAIIEAGPCSASMLCPVSLPTDDEVNLTAVWGSSATDVWAVGSGGTVLHYDGIKWEKAMLEAATPNGSTSFTLRSVWLERADDVWIADGNGIRHTTGWKGPSDTEWSFVSFPTGGCLPTSIRGIGNTIWIGRGPKPQASSCPWQVGRFEGWGDAGPNPARNVAQPFWATWGSFSLAVSRTDEAWASVHAVDGRPWIGAGNHVFRLSRPNDGGAPDAAPLTWQMEEYDSRTRLEMFGVWADEHAVWLAGEAGTLRRLARADLPNKRFEVVPSPVITDINGVFGFGADDVWAVGEGSTVLHWDGTSWSKLFTPFDDAIEKPHLRAVWGSSPADVWIVGDRTILHYQRSVP